MYEGDGDEDGDDVRHRTNYVICPRIIPHVTWVYFATKVHIDRKSDVIICIKFIFGFAVGQSKITLLHRQLHR